MEIDYDYNDWMTGCNDSSGRELDIVLMVVFIMVLMDVTMVIEGCNHCCNGCKQSSKRV